MSNSWNRSSEALQKQKGVAASPCLEYLPASAEDALGFRKRARQKGFWEVQKELAARTEQKLYRRFLKTLGNNGPVTGQGFLLR